MFEIVVKKTLGPKITLYEVKAPFIAKSALPGQFLIVRIDEEGERIPLTICDYDKEKGTITLVVQAVGAESTRMESLQEGDCFADVVGPLGRPSELTELSPEELKQKKLLFVAGGLGTAPVYAQLKWLHEQGCPADCIQGARTKDLLIMIDEMEEVTDTLYLATDDGSVGIHGNVTVALQQLHDEGKHYDLVIVIGPMIMMKFVCELTKKLGIPSIASMNTIMVDGTGMCGACRLLVDGEVKFACVDGPEFNGHLIDFDQAMQRAKLYKDQETRILLRDQEKETHHGGCGLCSE
ncbi:MAG: sulfide/dihydroorotate dehydrogenase-like FAD/NAD-binding protein [Lachnospiraceae bacterium]|nr:sulfide/dihydroorotate dehydrogenase-like FAD/NAD-binding protein [Lachnospiraceae bacterium]